MNIPHEIKTIVDQMGGRKIFAMAFSGSTYDMSSNPTITFQIAPALKRAVKMSHVRVTLMPSDTYRVEFLNVRGAHVKTVHDLDDVYCDNLKEVVESKTGLALSL